MTFKNFASLFASASVAVTLVFAASVCTGGYYDPVDGWNNGGWGWGGPFAVGLGGGLLGAALLAPGYGYNVPYGPPTYAIPYRSSCYWSRQRVYDYRGRLIGRHVQICH